MTNPTPVAPHSTLTDAARLLNRTLRRHWQTIIALAMLSTLLAGCAPLE